MISIRDAPDSNQERFAYLVRIYRIGAGGIWNGGWMDISHYNLYKIPKRSCGLRQIESPKGDLKEEQSMILRYLMDLRLRPHHAAHGFVKHRSAVTHAGIHVGMDIVIRIDIEDFFPSIKEYQIVSALLHEGFTQKEAEYISNKCTIDMGDGSIPRLPQGSPTSPFLSNLVFKNVDIRLYGLALSWDYKYSRYADDLTFSCMKDARQGIRYPVCKIIGDYGMKMNKKKYHVLKRGGRQMVTGLVVNDRVNVRRNERKLIRAILHRAKMNAVKGLPIECDLRVMEGKASYVMASNINQGRRFMREIKDIRRIMSIVCSST